MIERILNSGDLFVSKIHDVCLDENDKTLYDAEILNKLNVSGLSPSFEKECMYHSYL